MIDWLPWAPLAAATLHISEEFVYPGGFAAWYRRYRVDSSRITPRFLIVVNAGLVVACADVGLLGRTTPGIIYWLVMAAVMCSNGIWHAWASYKSRGYSPGVITGTLIYVPLAVYGCGQYVQSGEVSIATVLVAGIAGGSYHFTAVFLFSGLHGIVDDAHTKEKCINRVRLANRLERLCFQAVGLELVQ
jgi:hypothetical protein